MSLLDRYIGRTLYASVALVTLVLIGLQGFILFVNQLDDIGRADYGIWQAAYYILLDLPFQLHLFFPIACLIGGLVGLGNLASHSELIVMRAAGISILQIIVAVLKYSIFIIIIMTLLEETLIPKWTQMANNYKMQALSGGQALRTSHGLWLRTQNDFIFISTILPHHELKQVYQFRFNDNHHLALERYIEQLYLDKNHWVGKQVSETSFYPDHLESRHLENINWDVSIHPMLLGLSTHEPNEMTFLELHRYLKAKKQSHQSVINYKLAYWQHLVEPFTTLLMLILAIPFIFGPLRTSSMSSKILVGISLGFCFHIIHRFFTPLSQLLQIPPEIAAFGPLLFFTTLGYYLIKRAS